MDVVTLETPSLGDRSYLVHDGEAALVVDPQRDVDRVLAAADEAAVQIVFVAETHLHNDYVSGGLALARATGAAYGHAAAEDLPFDHRPLADGDRFRVGTLDVEVVHTPGHTPHHLSFVVRAGAGGAAGSLPVLFSGGSLLHGSVGRTDLISRDPAPTEELTRRQYRSAQELAARLPGSTGLHPTHGFGSFCASGSSGGGSDGTLGTERRVNEVFTAGGEDAFVARTLAGLDAYPAYYAHVGPLNRAGAFPPDLSPAAPADPARIRRRIHAGEWVVDLRPRRAFAAGHLAGTVNLEVTDSFATYLGWLLPWGTPVTLLADHAAEVAEAQRQLVRIGIDRPAGAAVGGPDAWAAFTDSSDRRSFRTATFADLAAEREQDGSGLAVVDVRRRSEWDKAHIDGALHLPVHELPGRVDDAPTGAELWVHCASGYRSAAAASLLERAGRTVVLVDDEFDRAGDHLPLRRDTGVPAPARP